MSVSVNGRFNNIPFSSNKNGKPDSNVTINGVELPGSKRLNYPPAVVGGLNGFCWFGVGMLFDKLFSKMLKSQSNSKISMAINGAFGLFMGYRAYKVAKKESVAASNDIAKA